MSRESEADPEPSPDGPPLRTCPQCEGTQPAEDDWCMYCSATLVVPCTDCLRGHPHGEAPCPVCGCMRTHGTSLHDAHKPQAQSTETKPSTAPDRLPLGLLILVLYFGVVAAFGVLAALSSLASGNIVASILFLGLAVLHGYWARGTVKRQQGAYALLLILVILAIPLGLLAIFGFSPSGDTGPASAAAALFIDLLVLSYLLTNDVRGWFRVPAGTAVPSSPVAPKRSEPSE